MTFPFRKKKKKNQPLDLDNILFGSSHMIVPAVLPCSQDTHIGNDVAASLLENILGLDYTEYY